MKRILNLFYTTQAKSLVAILIIVCSWLMNSELTEIFSLYKQDRTAVVNVFVQGKSYDYKTSYFLTNEIETAISDVIEYSLVYHRNKNKTSENETSAETIAYLAESFVKNKVISQIFIDEGFIRLIKTEECDEAIELDGKFFIQEVNYDKIISSDSNLDFDEFYKRATDESYAEIVRRLDKLQNFRFALVNHKTDSIVSNIPALDGKSPEVTVRRYFGDEKNLLIVRDAKTPYYESGTMSEYVEFVSEQAKKYPDNFDLYISFGTSMGFAGNGEDFSQRHENALRSIENSIKGIFIFLFILFILFVTIVGVSGKREFRGKTYPSLTDRMPNDLKLLLVLIVHLSMSALYENSLYMTLRVTNIENYWLNYSPEFYLVRSNISMVVMIFAITVLACTVKRQISCGTLFTNTYIYKTIKNFKKAEPSD